MTKPKRRLETRGNYDNESISGFWDKVDNYADYAEKALALGNLASIGATVAAPNPFTAGAVIATGVGSGIVDGYQGIRSAVKGDWGNVAKNGVELLLSFGGAKAFQQAGKLAKLDEALKASGAPREYVRRTIGRRPGNRHIYTTTKEADAATKASSIGYATSLGGNASSMGDLPIRVKHKYGGIHIAPSKRGTFTAAATKHGMGVQEFASKVLRNKEDYSPSLVKKANFARNASKWNH